MNGDLILFEQNVFSETPDGASATHSVLTIPRSVLPFAASTIENWYAKLKQLPTISTVVLQLRGLTGINSLIAKVTILKEINVLFVVYLCLGKYNFSFHIFIKFVYI